MTEQSHITIKTEQSPRWYLDAHQSLLHAAKGLPPFGAVADAIRTVEAAAHDVGYVPAAEDRLKNELRELRNVINAYLEADSEPVHA